MNHYDAELHDKIIRAADEVGLDPNDFGVRRIDYTVQPEFEHVGEIAMPARIERGLMRAERERAVERLRGARVRQDTHLAVIASTLVVALMNLATGTSFVATALVGAMTYLLGKAIFVR